MSTGTIAFIVILVVLIATIVALYFMGRRLQKRQAESQAQMEATKQSVVMLIIDKKKLRVKEAGLPPQVYAQTPWYLKRSKLPIVKAKVGSQVMNLVADDKIYAQLPVKTQVKATVSGIYIMDARSVRGQALPPAPAKAKGPIGRFMDKIRVAGGAAPVNKK